MLSKMDTGRYHIYIKDLMQDRKIMDIDEFQQKFPRLSWMDFHGLMSSIPESWKKTFRKWG